jgi:hypothetical protein
MSGRQDEFRRRALTLLRDCGGAVKPGFELLLASKIAKLIEESHDERTILEHKRELHSVD